MNKQLRGSVYSTSGGRILCVGFLCVLQDVWFVDSLVALSVMKAFVLRGNKHCRVLVSVFYSVSLSEGIKSGENVSN